MAQKTTHQTVQGTLQRLEVNKGKDSVLEINTEQGLLSLTFKRRDRNKRLLPGVNFADSGTKLTVVYTPDAD